MTFTYEDFLDVGHLNKLMRMGYEKMGPRKKEAAAKKMAEQQRQDYLAEIEDAAQASDWEQVCSIIKLRPFIMEEGFALYYDRIPDDMKYAFVTEIFTHNGDNCPSIREALIDARDYGSPDLPEWMGKTVTVYRGCCESIDEAPWSISWTTDQDVAEFFANRCMHFRRQKGHVYKGKICAAHIIAYTNDRHEHEVMQYGSVFDVEEIPFIPDRVTRIPDSEHCAE